MSSTNKTPNLNLHSWVRTDPVVCEDFNDNFNKIDSAFGSLSASRGNCEFYTGSYTGSGAKTLSLTFPKRPMYLIIQQDKYNKSTYSGFVLDGGNFFGFYSDENYSYLSVSGRTVTIQENGSGASSLANKSGLTYYYAAFAPAQ